MLKITFFLLSCFIYVKANEENPLHLRHNWLSRKLGHQASLQVPLSDVRERDQRSPFNDDDDKIDMRDIFKLVGGDEDGEELTTPTPYDSEVLSYGDDTKNYKVKFPLPQKTKDGKTANLMCYVPTRRGLIVTHCGLADNEGTCPKTKSCGFVIPYYWTVSKLCLSDFDCSLEQKCCQHTCYQHKVCQHPIPENAATTINHISIKQFINLNVNKETPETIESLLNNVFNSTSLDKALWNLTTSNSSDYNLTVAYSHDVFSHKYNDSEEDLLPLHLAVNGKEYEPNSLDFTNSSKDFESTSDIDGGKEFESNSNLTLTTADSSNEFGLDGSKEYESNSNLTLTTADSSNEFGLDGSKEYESNSNLTLTTTNSSNDFEPISNSTSTNNTEGSKEYEPNSNWTLTNTNKEYDPNSTLNETQHVHETVRILPLPNHFDPDAEVDEIDELNGSGSGDDIN